MMINADQVKALSLGLTAILEAELKAGNRVCEASIGGFSGSDKNHLFVWLKYPFRTAIRSDSDVIAYRLIDDPHYWKAEYDDEVNHQTLACHF